jgi:pimeloyl-ACP methyl ester carboxylesterase
MPVGVALSAGRRERESRAAAGRKEHPMTRQNSFKRLVRMRMEKTGESYTAARATLLAADEAHAPDGPALTMSDEAIRRATGRGWEEWFDLLDEVGAGERPHKEIARWLRNEQEVGGWWAQSVTVSYERARGLRAVGERPEGFSVTAQKTVAVPVDRLYDAFVDESLRACWLPGAELRERTATRPKSARFDWGDGATRLVVAFTAQGEAKSTAALEHERLPDTEEAERMKAFWRERMNALQAQLEGDAGTVTSRDGTRIAFERSGAGPALVLVDGALCFRSFGPMTPLAELLAPHFTVYRYDRRGRGESGDTAPYAVAREIEDLDAVIAEAGGAAFVFGISSGAVLALEAAASGSAISKLALYEPPLTVDEDASGESKEFGERLEQLVAEGRRDDAVEFFLSSAGVPADAIAAMRSEPSWALFESVAPTLVYDNALLGDGSVPRDRGATLNVPALVASGGDSPDFFRRAAEATADTIPGARHETLEGQSWGQVAPEALAPMLREFFV